MQNFPEIKGSDYVATGILDVQYRDQAVTTLYAGEKEPSNKFEGCAWNDIKNNQLKYWNGKNWEVVLDYGKVYIFSLSVSNNYQPLNSNLTAFGKIEVPSSGMGVLSQPSVPLSYYWLNSLQTSADIVNNLGLNDLAYRDEITTQRIEDDSVSKAKLSDSIKTEPVFVTGDTIPSFAPGTKKGCVKMSTSSNIVYTVGTSTSNSTYKGTAYRDLFHKLWNRSDLRIFTASGVNTAKSGDWESDWNANKRLELPHIDLPSDSFKTIIGETGQSNNVSISRSGYYEIKLCAGGGGGSATGAGSGGHAGMNQGSAAGGFLGRFLLQKGDTILCGGLPLGGSAAPFRADESSEARGGNGGDITMSVNRGNSLICSVTCTGGQGGGSWWRKGHKSYPAGTCSISINMSSAILSHTEITGNVGYGENGYGTLARNNGPFGDIYGSGGGCWTSAKYNGAAQDGGTGYFSVEFISPAEYHSTDQNIKSVLDNIYKSLSFFIKY